VFFTANTPGRNVIIMPTADATATTHVEKLGDVIDVTNVSRSEKITRIQ